MAPRKGTKAYEEEVIWVFYGIDRETNRVRPVYQQRNGTLTGTIGEEYRKHHVMRGRDAKSEAQMWFGITDIVMLPAALDNKEHYALKDLEAKAAKLRGD